MPQHSCLPGCRHDIYSCPKEIPQKGGYDWGKKCYILFVN